MALVQQGSLQTTSADITADDFRFLAEASGRFATCSDTDKTLREVCGMFVERFADFCAIFLADEGDRLEWAAWRHRDPDGQRILDRMAGLPVALDPRVTQAIRQCRTFTLAPDASGDLSIGHPEVAALVQKLDSRAAFAAPICVAGKSFGAILCARSASKEPFTPIQMSLVEEVAHRAGAAIEHVRLLERSQTEARRRTSAENRLDRLMSSNIVGILFTKFTGEIVECNDAFLELLGYSREELEAGALRWSDLTPPEFQDLNKEAVRQLQRNGACEPFEKEYLRKDGKRVPVLLVSTKLPEEDEADCITVVLDISERKRAEEAQRYLELASSTLSRSLDYGKTLDALAGLLVPRLAEWCTIHVVEDGRAECVAVAHEQPEKVRWAQEVQRKYPVDLDQPMGIPQVIRTGEPEVYNDITDEMIEASARDQGHLEALRQVELRSVLIAPLRGREGIVGTLSLVSGRPNRFQKLEIDLAVELGYRAGMAVDNARLFRSVEKLVEERTQALQAANRELEAFAYSVSHDLRAPLRSIMSASMIVLEDYGDKIGPDGEAELKRASAAAKRMSTLIDDLLEYSRLGRREMHAQDVDVTQLAQQVGAELSIPEHVLTVQQGLTAHADPNLLRVLLTNLIENAWKFSKGKPEPRIEVGSEGRPPSAFFVRDNGVGFDEQYAEKLFVPFERLHSPQEYPGTGIGLANVKRIAARHGGQVWAQGTPGEGAAFYFTLGPAKA